MKENQVFSNQSSGLLKRKLPGDIVCISNSAWDFLWTRKQRLMRKLAREGARVLYVNPRYVNRTKRLSPRKGLWQDYRFRVEHVEENLWVMTPPVSLPFGRFAWSRYLTNWRLADGIKRFMAAKGFHLPILWVYVPTCVGAAGRLQYRMLIYEAVDDHAEYPTWGGGMRRYIRACETEILKRADLVFVTSEQLLPGRAGINKHVVVSPNGVDIKLFSEAQSPETRIPEDITCLPRPILGFVGGIAHWTNLDMVAEIALRKPQWSIVMIGPVSSGLDLSRFSTFRNVHFLGRKAPESLPGYLKGIDVCLNLFKPIPLTVAVNPLKVYEYLAAGKPVVSTPMPEVEKFGDLIFVADEPDDFVSSVERALAWAEDPDNIKARMEAVVSFSWGRIFEEVIGKVRQFENVKLEENSCGSIDAN